MTKLILISDIHITKPGTLIIGLDPGERFHAMLYDALIHHADATRIILMGDLVHRGSRTEYARLKDLLTDCPLPITFMPGNHDRRAGFEVVFDQPFQQHTIDTPSHTVLCLDTLDEDAPDQHSGFMDDARLIWLRRALDASTKPVIVLTHHHLAPVGFDGMDAIRLRNGDAVADILRTSGKVDMVISGHIHRTISGSLQGLPFAILPSPCHQMPLQLGPGASGLSVDEPGGYGVLLLTASGPVLHDARPTEAIFKEDTASN